MESKYKQQWQGSIDFQNTLFGCCLQRKNTTNSAKAGNNSKQPYCIGTIRDLTSTYNKNQVQVRVFWKNFQYNYKYLITKNIEYFFKYFVNKNKKSWLLLSIEQLL